MTEPGDPAPGDKSPAWCWRGSVRAGLETGDRRRRERGDRAAGGEERRAISERRGPDIRRPLDARDPVCQSAGRGEMRRHRSIMFIDGNTFPSVTARSSACPCARKVARMRTRYLKVFYLNVLRLRVCGNCTVADNCQPIFLPFTLSIHLNRLYNRIFCQKKSMFNTDAWGR